MSPGVNRGAAGTRLPSVVIWATVGLSTLLWTGGCSSSAQQPPQVGFERGGFPEFAGTRVLVLPVQRREPDQGELDQELEYALAQRGEGISWVFPADLRSSVARNPGMGIEVDALPVQSFMVGELERIGDPLFGILYRLGALTDASYALIPVEARRRQADQGVRIELTAALVELRGGYVLWFGVVAGGEGAEGEPYLSATVAEALARRVIR